MPESYLYNWRASEVSETLSGITNGNCMIISNYNTKPIRGDRAIILKMHGFT